MTVKELKVLLDKYDAESHVVVVLHSKGGDMQRCIIEDISSLKHDILDSGTTENITILNAIKH